MMKPIQKIQVEMTCKQRMTELKDVRPKYRRSRIGCKSMEPGNTRLRNSNPLIENSGLPVLKIRQAECDEILSVSDTISLILPSEYDAESPEMNDKVQQATLPLIDLRSHYSDEQELTVVKKKDSELVRRAMESF